MCCMMPSTPIKESAERTCIKLSAPATVLIFGEYTVTENNAIGICMAIEPRAVVLMHIKKTGKNKNKIRENKMPVLQTLFGGKNITHIHPMNDSLFAAAWNCKHLFMPMYKRNKDKHIVNQPFIVEKICVDTSLFYDGCTKLGLGSSETAITLMCATLAFAAGFDPLDFQNKAVLAAHSCKAHFLWQNEKGSGYGVYATIYGGLGMYQRNECGLGGRWNTLDLTCFSGGDTPYMWFVWNGRKNVSSQKALCSYKKWKLLYPERSDVFFERCNKHALSIYKKGRVDNKTLCAWYKKAKKLGELLGNSIGVNATIGKLETMQKKYGRESFLFKAVGAGNECAVGFCSLSILAKLKKKTHNVKDVIMSGEMQYDQQ